MHPETQRSTRQRLAAVSLLVSLIIFGIVAIVLSGKALWGWFPEPSGAPARGVSPQLGLALLSLGMFTATRLPRLSARVVRRLGVAYQLLGAAILAFEAGWHPVEVRPGWFTWLALWILLFPLVVPRAPLRDLVLAAASAAAAPLALLAGAAWRGDPTPGPTEVFLFAHPYGACALLATAPSYAVHRLQLDMAQAKRAWQRLGSYRLVHPLASGGMGEVWYAEHQLLVRPAAVKLIRPETLALDDRRARDEALTRFEVEAQETSLLSSAHTVTIYDFGRTTDGAFFLAMELLEGLDLERLVREHGPLPAGRVVRAPTPAPAP